MDSDKFAVVKNFYAKKNYRAAMHWLVFVGYDGMSDVVKDLALRAWYSGRRDDAKAALVAAGVLD